MFGVCFEYDNAWQAYVMEAECHGKPNIWKLLSRIHELGFEISGSLDISYGVFPYEFVVSAKIKPRENSVHC